MITKNPVNKAAQLNEIQHGKGLQYLLDEIYKILRNPIVVSNMEYELIAHSDTTVCDDPIWIEFMTRGKLSHEAIEFFKNEGFIDEMSNSTMRSGVTYLISDKLKYDRVFGQLYNKNNVPVASMIVLNCETPFNDDTPGLIKVACDVITKELAQSAYYQDYGQAYQENVIRVLLEGSIVDNQIYTGHVANIDKDLKINIFVAVADIGQCDAAYSKLVYYRDLFKQALSNYEYYIYQNYIVMLMSWDNDVWLEDEEDIKKLLRLFEQENIFAGISGRFENLFALRKYYAQALEALHVGLHGDGDKRICFFDDIDQDDDE